ncbi:MAG TPA: hypothetical protein VLR45_10800, partial [Desulfoprunum sp.]|nr:hypothetical protein [Desulfoprunum sp.]
MAVFAAAIDQFLLPCSTGSSRLYCPEGTHDPSCEFLIVKVVVTLDIKVDSGGGRGQCLPLSGIPTDPSRSVPVDNLVHAALMRLHPSTNDE